MIVILCTGSKRCSFHSPVPPSPNLLQSVVCSSPFPSSPVVSFENVATSARAAGYSRATRTEASILSSSNSPRAGDLTCRAGRCSSSKHSRAGSITRSSQWLLLASSLPVSQNVRSIKNSISITAAHTLSSAVRRPVAAPRDTEHVLVMCRTRRRAPRRCPVKRQPPPPTRPGRDHHHRARHLGSGIWIPPVRRRPDLAAAAAWGWLDRRGSAPDQSCRAFFHVSAAVWRYRTCRGVLFFHG